MAEAGRVQPLQAEDPQGQPVLEMQQDRFQMAQHKNQELASALMQEQLMNDEGHLDLGQPPGLQPYNAVGDLPMMPLPFEQYQKDHRLQYEGQEQIGEPLFPEQSQADRQDEGKALAAQQLLQGGKDPYQWDLG